MLIFLFLENIAIYSLLFILCILENYFALQSKLLILIVKDLFFLFCVSCSFSEKDTCLILMKIMCIEFIAVKRFHIDIMFYLKC